MVPDGGPTPVDELERRLDAEVRRRFPGVERVVEHGMAGWRVPRPRTVAWTTGTMDPNALYLFLADRRQGPTVHFWNPFDYGALARNRAALEDAGFKVMVGCVQFPGKRPFPVKAVGALLDEARRQMDEDARLPAEANAAGEARPARKPAKKPAKTTAAKSSRAKRAAKPRKAAEPAKAKRATRGRRGSPSASAARRRSRPRP